MIRLYTLSKIITFLGIAIAAIIVACVVPAALYIASTIAALVIGYAMWCILCLKRDIEHIEAVSNACSQGEMERRIILPHARGEMLRLMDSVNRFIDVADAYIRESGASADHAAQGKFYRSILLSGLNGTWNQAADGLNKSAQQVRQNLIRSVQEAGKRLEASVMQTIMQLSGSTQQLMGTSQTLNDVATKGSSEAATLSTSTGNTSQSVSTIAAAVEEMTAAIQEISKQVYQSNTLSNDAMQRGEETRATLENLVGSSERIGEVAELINAIAAQVNLLALNATIEAARAGEAGKGFAVVASEVKELAKRTSAATAQVEQYIQEIRNEVIHSREALNSILGKIGELNQASCMIASAIEQQSATTRDISSNLQLTSHTVEEFAGSVNSMANASDQTKTAAEEMLNSSKSLAEASETLKQDINHFIQSLDRVA